MGKVSLKDFEIPITGSRQSDYSASFEIDSDFFELFENSLLKKGDLKADVGLFKTETLIDAKIKIHGKIELVCDRSLEEFDQDIFVEREHVFKYGDHEEEFSEEMTLIPFDTFSINLAQIFYEYIGLEIPFRKLHPRFRNEDGSEKDFVFESDTEKKENEIDPRWEELKKIKK